MSDLRWLRLIVGRIEVLSMAASLLLAALAGIAINQSTAAPVPPAATPPKNDAPNLEQKITDAYPEGSDPFPLGKLPVLKVAARRDVEVVPFSHTGSMGFGGNVDPPLDVGIRVDLSMITDGGAKRVIAVGVEAHKERNGVFSVNLYPPDGGWPRGLMRVRTSIGALPKVYSDEYYWTGDIADLPAERPPIVDDYKDLLRMDVLLDDVPFEATESQKLSFCGRLESADTELPRYLEKSLLAIERLEPGGRRISYHSAHVIWLRDASSFWFEDVTLFRPGRSLKPGRYLVTLTPRTANDAVWERELIVRPMAPPEN